MNFIRFQIEKMKLIDEIFLFKIFSLSNVSKKNKKILKFTILLNCLKHVSNIQNINQFCINKICIDLEKFSKENS